MVGMLRVALARVLLRGRLPHQAQQCQKKHPVWERGTLLLRVLQSGLYVLPPLLAWLDLLAPLPSLGPWDLQHGVVEEVLCVYRPRPLSVLEPLRELIRLLLPHVGQVPTFGELTPRHAYPQSRGPECVICDSRCCRRRDSGV